MNVSNIVFFEKLSTLGGRDDAVITKERCGHHADPEDHGGGVLGSRASPMRTTSVLVHLTFIESRRAWSLRVM